jgi:hypothetical protein
MASNQNYLKDEFTKLIDTLELSDLDKQFMKSRWLDQLLWLEGRAKSTKKWSSRLRLMTIIGGVLVPAFVSLNFNDNMFGQYIGWVTFGLSQIVAISASVEEYFGFSEKQTLYRKTAESLKSEAWKFFQLTGSYNKYSDHSSAYSTFAFRVEKFIQEDVQAIVELAKESNNEQEKQQQQNHEAYASKSKSVNETGNRNVSAAINGSSWQLSEDKLPFDKEPLEPTSGDSTQSGLSKTDVSS